MFKCPNCKEFTAKYDFIKKTIICSSCSHEETVIPDKANCYRCGREYLRYTWFDPSGCECGRSFVD